MGDEDPRSMGTKVRLAKNKLRAMGLKMSYDMEGEMTEATYPSDFINPDGSKRSVAKKKTGRPVQHDQPTSGGRRKTVDEGMTPKDKMQSSIDRSSSTMQMGRRTKSAYNAARGAMIAAKQLKRDAAELKNESSEDRLRDRRMERGGVDGNTRYDRAPKAPNTKKFGTGKTMAQKEMEKKYGKGATAMDVVKAEIRAKHGKGAIKD